MRRALALLGLTLSLAAASKESGTGVFRDVTKASGVEMKVRAT